jgi:hypothetical protein
MVSDFCPRLAANYFQLADIGFLVTPTMNLNVDLLSQLSTKIFNVYPSASINVGRIFTGKESGSQ